MIMLASRNFLNQNLLILPLFFKVEKEKRRERLKLYYSNITSVVPQ